MRRFLLALAVIPITPFVAFGAVVYERPVYEYAPQPQESMPAVMRRIAKCESRDAHYVDGELVRGEVTPEDVGRFQINEGVWGEIAHKKGLDLSNEVDNYRFALWLYENYGTEPWSASKHCWQWG